MCEKEIYDCSDCGEWWKLEPCHNPDRNRRGSGHHPNENRRIVDCYSCPSCQQRDRETVAESLLEVRQRNPTLPAIPAEVRQAEAERQARERADRSLQETTGNAEWQRRRQEAWEELNREKDEKDKKREERRQQRNEQEEQAPPQQVKVTGWVVNGRRTK